MGGAKGVGAVRIGISAAGMDTSKGLRWIVSGLLLFWSGSGAFRAPIDDLYITTAFAHELVNTGRLQWTTGEAVEGMTSIPWTGVVAVGALLGVDAALWARIASGLVALGFLALLSRRAHPGLGGTLLLWITASWTSFSLWAVSGFEMTLFAALVALGWTATAERRWTQGTVLLVASAVIRPEGWALAFAAAALAGWEPRSAKHVGWVFLAVSTWSVARFAMFGSLLPTPFLVKFVANPHTWAGLVQVGTDLVVAIGPLLAFALVVREGARERGWASNVLVLVPLVLGAALLVSADGDWFAAGRMTLAGLLTLAYAVAPRLSVGVPSASLLAVAGVASAMLRAPYGYTVVEHAIGELPSRMREGRAPLAEAFGSGIRTPLLQELAWTVRSIGEGDCLLTADVGMLGNVNGVCIRDRVGLVDRAFAEFNAGFATDPRALPSARRIVAERVIWRDARPTVPEMALDAEWPARAAGEWGLDFWRRAGSSLPLPDQVEARWRALAERYPWQPELWWGWGVFAAEAGAGDMSETIRAAAWRWPSHPLATETQEMTSFADRVFLRDDYVPGRGFPLIKPGQRTSRPLGTAEALALAVDSDNGPVTLLVGWEGEGCPLDRSEVVATKRGFALPAAPCPAARVSVWFLDEGAGAGDSNAYVALRAPRGEDVPLPSATRTDLPLEGSPEAEWVPNRGWAMWWNRTLHTDTLAVGTTLALSFDVDAPGAEGAQAVLAWEPPCAAPVPTAVHALTSVSISVPCTARLTVQFQNDQALPADRNLYVGVRVAVPAAQ